MRVCDIFIFKAVIEFRSLVVSFNFRYNFIRIIV